MRLRTISIAIALGGVLLPATPAPAAERLRVGGETVTTGPEARDFSVDLRLAPRRRLKRMWLDLVDNTTPGADPRVVVVGPGAMTGLVRRRPWRISAAFALPLWDTGANVVAACST